ncbi:reverse transcriptase [Senna tora]|uniref:Reverse transcriptase n=1 Tax=Senna tora TaxID=362788 RepID=A0A834TVK3_9FABA|nr:reverse transcriptase [Senna tora]
MHILRDCPVSTSVWNQLPLPQNFFSLPHPIWLKNNCTNSSPSLKNIPWNTIFAFSCYAIWHQRNHLIHHNSPLSPLLVARSAIHKAIEYHFLAAPNPQNTNISHLPIHWTEPKKSFCKLNIDGAASNNLLGTGGIIRNDQGYYMISFCKFLGQGSSVQAELWALQIGLSIARDINISHIEIETDCTMLIHLINNNQLTNLHPLFSVICTCRHFLSAFDSWELKHIYREANGCADALAKHARMTCCNSCTFLEPLVFLLPLLAKDRDHRSTIRRISFRPP